MKPKKRLGKSLEDISHLFLSTPAPEEKTAPVREIIPYDPPKAGPRNEGMGGEKTRVWLSLSLVPGLPSAFFSGNLAVELARNGKKVLMVETADVPSLDGVFGSVPIQPSLGELLDQSQKSLTFEGPRGIRILSFRLKPRELEGFSPDERDILAQIFSREEENAEFVMVHARFEEDPVFDHILRSAQGVVLAATPSQSAISEIYRVCKYLFRVHPDLRLGLISYDSAGENGRNAVWMGKLVEAARHFLGKGLEWYGTIPR
ncbi:MAG TPA: hypothetical protein VIU33_03905, partial [Nitrospiria bacterium]